jgi:hypothetical protein
VSLSCQGSKRERNPCAFPFDSCGFVIGDYINQFCKDNRLMAYIYEDDKGELMGFELESLEELLELMSLFEADKNNNI